MRFPGWLRPVFWPVLLIAHTSAPANTAFGLYDLSQFRTATADCQSCPLLPQARWYFNGEIFAVPAAGQTVTTYATDKRGADDTADLHPDALPGLVWTGATQQWKHVRLLAGGRQVRLPDGTETPFSIVPKIPTNLSYWNQDTQAFYSQRPLNIRGEQTGQQIIARSLWPEDFRLNLQAPLAPLQTRESLQQLVQFEHGGARSAYASRLLWQKTAASVSQLAGKSALGILLNGAQGDDDEAHGGHFALVTGVMNATGDYSHWLVNNYYNLTSHSEKGIISAVTPMDKYMADLNSGQAFYRPSYMLVAVFSQPDIPAYIQALSNRVQQHYYRNDLVYDLARNNCTGMSVDVLRQLGWQIPERGTESLFKASALYWYAAISEGSLQQGRAMYDYLNTEMTRLFPAVAFDAIGNDLLHIARTGDRNTLSSGMMQAMPQQLEAIYFVRIPQIPSSRASGQAPVDSFAQYLQRVPADRNQWQTIPVTPNPLPEYLKDGLALTPEKPALVPVPAMLFLIGVAGIIGLLLAIVYHGIQAWRKCRPAH